MPTDLLDFKYDVMYCEANAVSIGNLNPTATPVTSGGNYATVSQLDGSGLGKCTATGKHCAG